MLLPCQRVWSYTSVQATIKMLKNERHTFRIKRSARRGFVRAIEVSIRVNARRAPVTAPGAHCHRMCNLAEPVGYPKPMTCRRPEVS